MPFFRLLILNQNLKESFDSCIVGKTSNTIASLAGFYDDMATNFESVEVCYGLLKYYIEFFEKGHSEFNYKFVSEKVKMLCNNHGLDVKNWLVYVDDIRDSNFDNEISKVYMDYLRKDEYEKTYDALNKIKEFYGKDLYIGQFLFFKRLNKMISNCTDLFTYKNLKFLTYYNLWIITTAYIVNNILKILF